MSINTEHVSWEYFVVYFVAALRRGKKSISAYAHEVAKSIAQAKDTGSMAKKKKIASESKRAYSDVPVLHYRFRRWVRNCRVCKRRNISSSCNWKKSFMKRRSAEERSKGVWEKLLRGFCAIFTFPYCVFILIVCSNRQWYNDPDFSQLPTQYTSALRTAPAQLARWVQPMKR